MTTVTAVLEQLHARRMDEEFVYTPQGLGLGSGAAEYYQPDELKIIKVYRFEGESDPADSAILYLIEAPGHKIGYSLDAYVADNGHSQEYNNFIRQIPVEDRDEALIFNL
ncbi:hypothetical protein GCM10023143_15300 [Compostibacter hankyongensis]|uniref:Phosphoribosylpyrophosphate synthetase n=2 Tax=Compostibacter hankyongensis TaxID=1007089 RepID=A0ABP8FP73_9BACT